MAQFRYSDSPPDRGTILRGLADRGIVIDPSHHLSDDKLRALWKICEKWGIGGSGPAPASHAFSERMKRSGARGPLSPARREQLLGMTQLGAAALANPSRPA